MAKKKTTTVITDERNVPDAEVAIPDKDVGDDGLEGLLGLAAGGERYTVHKEPSAPGGKRAYCATYTREEISLDVIRDAYGGGDYRITGFDSENKLTESKRVTIIDVPKPRQDLITRDERPQREDSTQALLMQFIKSQGDMVSALLNRPQVAAPAGPTIMEIITLVKSLTPAPGKDPTEILLEGLRLGQDLGGGDEGLMGLAKTAIGALPALAARNPRAAAQPAAPVHALAPAAPSVQGDGFVASATPSGGINTGFTPKTNGAPPVDNVLKQVAWLRQIVAQLTYQAARAKDPELYADVFMDNLPDFVEEDEVYRRFAEESALEDLFKLHPPAKQYEVWFKNFRQCVLDSFVDDEAPPPGDIGDDGPGEQLN